MASEMVAVQSRVLSPTGDVEPFGSPTLEGWSGEDLTEVNATGGDPALVGCLSLGAFLRAAVSLYGVYMYRGIGVWGCPMS